MTYMCCFFSGKIHGFLFIAILVSFLLSSHPFHKSWFASKSFDCDD